MNQAMRSPRKLSAALVLLAALLAAVLVAGCGGGSSSGGGGEDPARLAPTDAPVYVEANLAPDSEEADNLNELADTVVGIDDIGEFITDELEKSALGEGEKFNYEEEVEPWLGEKAGLYFSEIEGGDLSGLGAAVETTDAGEAEEFIEKRIEEGDEGPDEEEFEGHKFWISDSEGTAIGIVGEDLVIGETKTQFEEMVKASEAEGLSEAPKFTKAIEAAGETGVGRVYVDIGGLIKAEGSRIPPETEAFFSITGIEPSEATAVVSAVPHSEALEIDVSTDATNAVQSGDASALLESLPATAVAGLASPEVGKSLGESFEELDKKGVPGQIEPGELGPGLKSAGIDIESLAESLGDVAAFAEGSSAANIGGALEIETKNASEAQNTVSNLGLLLRATRTPGVTPLSGNLTGFQVSTPELGEQPLIVGTSGEKIVIAYGSKAAAQALRSQSKTLGSTADFEAAKSGLGSTPISLFVDGGPTLKLVKGILSPEEAAEFSGAEPYVEKISYIGAGSETKGDATNAKIIIGLHK